MCGARLDESGDEASQTRRARRYLRARAYPVRREGTVGPDVRSDGHQRMEPRERRVQDRAGFVRQGIGSRQGKPGLNGGVLLSFFIFGPPVRAASFGEHTIMLRLKNTALAIAVAASPSMGQPPAPVPHATVPPLWTHPPD